jgi:hypothetical protein
MPDSPMPTMQSRAADRIPTLRHAAGRRRLAWACGVAGVAACVVATIGIAGRVTGYLIVDRVTGHVASAVLLTLALLLLAACLAPVSAGWRALARALVASFLALCWLGAAGLTLLVADFGKSRHLSPDGRSVLVVSEGAAAIDPVWELSVRRSSWLVARSWPVGCFNGDDPDNGLEAVRWVSPTQLEATDGSGRKYVVTIDSTDSRPSDHISVGCDD